MIPQTSSNAFRITAWNGIRLAVPTDWRIGTIDNNYLIFENEFGPALEAKWTFIKGRFDFKSNLRRLHGPIGGKDKLQFHDLPDGAAQALSEYQVQVFSWRTPEGRSGRGALIFCPTAGAACLLHFPGRPDADYFERVLSSFYGPRADGKTEFRIFDIEALTPPGFSLSSKKFQPGWFELTFSDPHKSTLRFLRFSPAKILLSGLDLEGFAARHLELARDRKPDRIMDGIIAEWSSTSSGRGGRLLARIRKPWLKKLRLWELRQENRILGVEMSSRQESASELFEDLCRNYNVV